MIDLNGLNYTEIKKLLVQEKCEMEFLTRGNIGFIIKTYYEENKIDWENLNELNKLSVRSFVIMDLIKVLSRTNNWKKMHGRQMKRKARKGRYLHDRRI